MNVRVAFEIGIVVVAIVAAIIAWVWSWQFSRWVKGSIADVSEPNTELDVGVNGVDPIPVDPVPLAAEELISEELEEAEEGQSLRSQFKIQDPNLSTSEPTSTNTTMLAFIVMRSRRWKGKRQQQIRDKLRQRLGVKQRRLKAIAFKQVNS